MPISRALFADLLRINDQVLLRVMNAHCKNKIQTTIALSGSSNKEEKGIYFQIHVICTCGDFHLYTTLWTGVCKTKTKESKE
jgi:hypothetical protein